MDYADTSTQWKDITFRNKGKVVTHPKDANTGCKCETSDKKLVY